MEYANTSHFVINTVNIRFIPIMAYNFKSLCDTIKHITIAVVGPVSCGKTSFLGMLMGKSCGTVSKKRATMSTTIYEEERDVDTENHTKQIEAIGERDQNLYEKKDDNKGLNDDLKHAFSKNVIQIPQIDFFQMDRKTETMIRLVDIPGLNDSSTKDLYFKHVEDNFSRFSMIMAIFDINGAMNTSDEMDILQKTVELAKKTYEETGIVQHLIIVANKCDEMTYCEKSDTLRFVEEEDKQLFTQLSDTVQAVVTKVFPKLSFELVRISAENSFIYNQCKENLAAGKPATDCLGKRYIDKLGVAEHGKKWNRMTDDEQTKKLRETLTIDDIMVALYESGCTHFTNRLADHLTPRQQKDYRLNNLKLCLKSETSQVDPEYLYQHVLCSGIGYRSSRSSDSEDSSSDSEDSEDSSSYRKRRATRLFFSHILKICKKHAELLSDFGGEEGSGVTEIQATFQACLPSLWAKLLTQMNHDLTAIESVVITPTPIPETIQRIEGELYEFLSCLRDLSKRVDGIYNLGGCDALGLSLLIDKVCKVLLSYYKKIVESASADYKYVMTLIDTKIPYVDANYERNEAVKALFENNENILQVCGGRNPKGNVSELSSEVIEFLKKCCEDGIVTIDERNQILHSFIVRLYNGFIYNVTAPVGRLVSDIFRPFVHYSSAAQLVWNMLGQCRDINQLQKRYETFLPHLSLFHQLRVKIPMEGYSAKHAPSVLIKETLEYVCVKWHFPEVFPDNQMMSPPQPVDRHTNDLKRPMKNRTTRATRSKKSRK